MFEGVFIKRSSRWARTPDVGHDQGESCADIGRRQAERQGGPTWITLDRCFSGSATAPCSPRSRWRSCSRTGARASSTSPPARSPCSSAYPYAVAPRKGEMLLYPARPPEVGRPRDHRWGSSPPPVIALALAAAPGRVAVPGGVPTAARLAAARPGRRVPRRADRDPGRDGRHGGHRTGGAQALFPVERWEWGSLVILSDRFYLAVTIVVVTVDPEPGLQVHPLRPVHPGVGGDPDRCLRERRLPGPGRPRQLDDQRRGGRGSPASSSLPISPLTPVSYTLFVIPALAAAVVGGSSTWIRAVVAGLAIGMLQAEAINLASMYSWMPQTAPPSWSRSSSSWSPCS